MTRFARPARVLLVVYLAFLALVLFSPSSGTQSGVVGWISQVLVGWGATPATPVRVEVLVNALMIAPVSLLGSVVLPRSRWQDWTAYGFVGAAFVETVQGLFLPGRSASFTDIVANAAGAFLGAVVFHAVRLCFGVRSA